MDNFSLLFVFLFHLSASHKHKLRSVPSILSTRKKWTGKEPGKNVANKRIVHSMETEEEWHFVKNLTKERKKERWFIGLKRVNGSHMWCWLSEIIACVNVTSTGTWRWTTGEPNNLEREKCVAMLQHGKYNNIVCQARNHYGDPGYICEKQVSKFIIMPKLC